MPHRNANATANPGSIRNLVRLGDPLAKQFLGGLAGQLHHREGARGDVERDLLVDEIVVEADAGGVAPSTGVINSVEPRPVNRGETHRTGLTARVEDAAAQIETLQCATGIANRRHFRVRGRIEQARHLIASAADDLATGNDYRAERAAATFAHSGATERDGFAHPTLMERRVFAVIGRI